MSKPARSPGDALSGRESTEIAGLPGRHPRLSSPRVRLATLALIGGLALATAVVLTALPARSPSAAAAVETASGLSGTAAPAPGPIGAIASGGQSGPQLPSAPTSARTRKLGFAAAETQVCVAARQRVDAAGLPSENHLAGWAGRIQATLSWTIAALRALHPPPARASALAAFRTLLSQESGLFGALRTAAAGGESARVATLAKRISPIEAKLQQDAGTLGFRCGESAAGVVGAPPLPSCDAAGVSALAAREGICLGPNLVGNGVAVTNVVDAGHTVHMPGYDVRLLATQVHFTHVNNPGLNPGENPGGRGWLVSFKLAVRNTGAGPLRFDSAGKDTQLSLPLHGVGSLSVPESVNPFRGPSKPIADLGTLAPHATATGWVSFVAPSWTRGDLHARSCDLLIFPVGDTSGDYLGELRLWKWASPQGRSALGLPVNAPPAPNAPPSATVQ